MPVREYFISDPQFEEYVFHVMRLSTDEERRVLNPEELHQFRNEKNMRRFAENQTLDKRVLMLTRLGSSFTMVFSHNKEQLKKISEQIPEQYKSGETRRDLIKAMGQNKLFVLSSRDALIMTHIMAQNTHSQVFTLDYQYIALKEKLNNYRIRPFSEEVEDSISAIKDMSNLVLQCLNSDYLLTSLTGVTIFEMRIMLALYQHRNTMITNRKVSQMLGESIRAQYVGRSCNELAEKEFIMKEQPGRKTVTTTQRYMLAEKGINAVLVYLKYIIKHSL